jgi:tetratricopeptide (TPR) repeat protein
MSSPPLTCSSCSAALTSDAAYCPLCGAPTLPEAPGPRSIDTLQRALSGRYRIQRELGRGGMAMVYLAEDMRHGREVAIKVMRPELAAALGKERFLREIAMAARLTHVHILALYDSGEAGGILYYVMPYVEGESLRMRLMRERQLAVDDALRIGQEVAEALAHAHSHDILHRDIKPENILLSGGHALVSDFGIARAISAAGGDRLTGTGLALGTPAYMSPEQSSADVQLDGRSDIYALGCVLYEMLAGEPPYTGPTPLAVMAKHLSQPVPSVSTLRTTVGRDLEAVITRALAKVPADRFATVAQFADALALVGRPVPLGLRVDAVADVRARLRWGGIVLVGLALVGVFVWGVRHLLSGRAPPLTPNRVAVFPFAYNGAGDFRHLGAGIVGLLSTVLDGVGKIHTVDPSAVLGLVEQQSQQVVDPVGAQRIAERLGAGRYVVGSIVEDGEGRVNIIATAYDLTAPSRGPVRASVEGDATGHLFRLVNDLAVQLRSAFGIEESPRRLESVSTGSVAALNEYLKGEAALRAGDYRSAAAAFRAAVDADTLFALAWYRLAYGLSFTERAAEAPGPLARALRLGDRLSERDRRLAQAFSALLQVQAEQADRLYRGVLSDYPDDVEAWFGLADLHLHFGPLYGLPMDSVSAGFRRVLYFDSHHSEALVHLPWAVGLDGSIAAFDSAASRLLVAEPDGFFGPVYRAVLAFARADTVAEERAIARLRAGDDLRKFLAVNAATTLPSLHGTQVLATRLLTEPSLSPEVRAYGHIVMAHLSLAQGRWREAQRHLAAADSLDPATALEDRALLTLAPLLDPPRGDLLALRARLERWDAARVPRSAAATPWFTPHDGLHAVLRLYLLGAVSVRLGDSPAALRYASHLEGFDPTTEQGILGRSLAHSLRAQGYHAAGRRAEEVREFELGELHAMWDRTYSSPFFSQSSERFLRADALQALGRRPEALRWYESVWMQNCLDQIYSAPSHLRRAEIYESLGDREHAIEQYRRFVELWRDADPELRAEVERARRHLEEVTAR